MAESSKRAADGSAKSREAKRIAVHREKTKKAMGRLRRILYLSDETSAIKVLESAAQYIEFAEQKENRMPGFRPMADLLPKPVAAKGPISDSVLTLLLGCVTDFDHHWGITMEGGPEIVNARLGKLINEFGSMANLYESAFEDLEMLVQVKLECNLHQYARIIAIAFACKQASRVPGLQPGMVRKELTESGKQAEQAITQWVNNRKKTVLKTQK
jgi:hypothetical protein